MNWRPLALFGVLACLCAGAAFVVNSTLFGGAWVPWRATIQRTPTPDSEEHELVFAETDVDLGEVREPVERRFEFENRGERLVRITKVRASCSCTLTQPDRKEIPPGEKGRLGISIDPTRLAQGRHAYQILVEYDGPGPRTLALVVRFRNVPDVIPPESLDLRVAVGAVGSAKFRLTDNRDRPLVIREIVTSSPDLRVAVLERPKAYASGWHYQLEARYTGKRPLGDYQETITLKTDDEARPEIRVHARVRQVRRIRVAPESVKLRANENKEIVGKIFVDDSEGEAVEISRLMPSDPALSCRILPTEADQRIVEIRWASKTPPPPGIRLTLALEVARPCQESITVQVVP